MIVAVHLVHIPATDRYLFMERPSGYHPDNSRFIAGSLDIPTGNWTHLDSPDGLFCCGHTLMSNGSVAIVGGHVANAGWPAGIQSLRTFTDGSPALVKATSLRYPRWYPTATLLPDGQILIMGGTQGVGAGTAPNPYYEIWNPATPAITQQLQVDPGYLKAVRQNFYPFMYVLPTGDVFNWCNRIGWILDPYTAQYKVKVPNRPTSAVSPKSIYSSQYPFTASSVMLALRPENNYAVEVMIFGGAEVAAAQNLSLPGCSESLRISITASPSGGTAGTAAGTAAGRQYSYSFGRGWAQEFMGSPRVMPDATLLPNGVVILLNGAATGLAGDSGSGGDSRANGPNLFAEMYDPYAPEGRRWSTLARSQIARMYHSTAALTINGTILVAGCDRCWKMSSPLQFSPPPAKAEYRSEIFYPPFWYAAERKPSILSAPQSVIYNQTFNVTYTGEQDPYVQVTSAVLVAPSATTHSFNTNQRVIKLVMRSDPRSNVLHLTAPPTRNHAPPQTYMLFLLNDYIYSKGAWVVLA